MSRSALNRAAGLPSAARVMTRHQPGQAAPSNYVAGAGRGAAGFTTRSDIGPGAARPPAGAVPGAGAPPSSYRAGAGRGAVSLNRDGDDHNADRFDGSTYDEFSGYTDNTFKGGAYDDDDKEADDVYAGVDDHMDERRKRRREERAEVELKRQRKERPKISDQFADIKATLGGVSEAEWAAIPDIGDYSLKYKQKAQDQFTPVPDHIIAAAQSSSGGASGTGGLSASIGGGHGVGGGGGSSSQQQHAANAGLSGGQTPISGAATDLRGMSDARELMLRTKLDKMGDSVSGQTVVDPQGYLTDLNSLNITSSAEIGDIKKARLLLKSVTQTNPKHAPGWIAAARLEEAAGKLVAARKLIQKGCEVCPDSEDIWIEAARLQTPANAATIYANAVRHMPNSVKIWINASELEETQAGKRTVLRRALEFVPNSVKLWKAAVQLESEDDARVMLSRAVECVPHSVDMWLALAKLETYGNAQKVLNRARSAIPTEMKIWITAAELEEASGGAVETMDAIIKKAVKSLKQNQVVIDREKWLKEAETSEKSEAPLVAGAIVRATIDLGVEPEDRKRTWLDDAATFTQRGSIACARAVYAHALTVFRGKKGIWQRAAMLEKRHGTPESLEALLKKAVSYCPQAEVLWLMAAKEKWLSGDVPGARAILMEAFAANHDNENIWLAAVKLEWENNELERARMLLSKARTRADTERVWLKSALLERETGQGDDECKILDAALTRYPLFDKLWMMRAQLEERQGGDRAKEFFRKGLRAVPASVPLWIMLARHEERHVSVAKARGVLELARLKSPKTPELWLEAVRLERRHDGSGGGTALSLSAGSVAGEGEGSKLATSLMAKALQDCPAAGILWAEDIAMAPRPRQKVRRECARERGRERYWSEKRRAQTGENEWE